ncbi:GNAT family N-acetyltransferase [Marinobacteraceae bacterium S3BR75-40.1]
MIQLAELQTASERTALDRFYKRTRQKARLGGDDRAWWALQGSEIVGAVRLCYPAFGAWLRTLYVMPEWRQMGVGSNLIRQLLAEAEAEQVWCLPFAPKAPLYGRCGFCAVSKENIPQGLQDRWSRYQRSGIDLEIMAWERPAGDDTT